MSEITHEEASETGMRFAGQLVQTGYLPFSGICEIELTSGKQDGAKKLVLLFAMEVPHDLSAAQIAGLGAAMVPSAELLVAAMRDIGQRSKA